MENGLFWVRLFYFGNKRVLLGGLFYFFLADGEVYVIDYFGVDGKIFE